MGDFAASGVTNAVLYYLERLPGKTLRRLGGERCRDWTLSRTTIFLESEFDMDLAGFLNHLNKEELFELCVACTLEKEGASLGELRICLWKHGAALEVSRSHILQKGSQLLPVLMGERLYTLSSYESICPTNYQCPPALGIREGEPADLDDLLCRAHSLMGTKFSLSKNKGVIGQQIALGLGLQEDNVAEPDWRGEVEVKSLPVVETAEGYWRPKEDPAISMETVSPLGKMQKILWMVRSSEQKRGKVLFWYYQELDAGLTRLAHKYLHTRPKGPANTDKRGWYLHKNFFFENGLLLELNRYTGRHVC